MAFAEGVRFLLGTASLKKDASYKIHNRRTDNEGFPSGRQADKLVTGPGTASRPRGIIMKVGH